MSASNADQRFLTDHELALQLMETCRALGMSHEQAMTFISRMLKNRRAEDGLA